MVEGSWSTSSSNFLRLSPLLLSRTIRTVQVVAGTAIPATYSRLFCVFGCNHNSRQETLPDGGCVVRFVNGDLKRVEGGTGVVVYTYAAARTTHTMHPSGLEVFEFPNGQVWCHFFAARIDPKTWRCHSILACCAACCSARVR